MIVPLSPCISLCSLDQDTMQCLGCGRTVEEKRSWVNPDTTNEWKNENIKQCKTRLTPIQLDYWEKSYMFKQVHGTSMHKYGKFVRKEL